LGIRDSDLPKPRRRWYAFHFRGLTVQIVLWMIIPLSLVLIGVAFTGVYSHEQAMRTLVVERNQALAELAARQVRELLQERASALEALAAEQAFHHPDPGEQRARLTAAGSLNGLFVDGLVLLDESGDVSATGADLPTWAQSATPLPDLAREVMAHQHVVIRPAPGTAGPQDLFLVGVPVRDEVGTLYGALVGAVSPESMGVEPLLSGVQVGEQGSVYLVDASGQVLAGSRAARAQTGSAGGEGMPTAPPDEAHGSAMDQAGDGEMTVAYSPVDLDDVGWQVVVEQPWSEVIGPVLRFSQFVPLVAALAVVVSVLALYYGMRAIARPLQSLGERAERVARGDFEATGSPVGGVEEIEDLRRSLDQMAKRIQSYQLGMHDYIGAMTHGQEEERKRLARELHDDTVQTLIALGQQVEMAERALPADPKRAAERLHRVRAMLAEAVEGVRRFSRDLRPIYLEDLGFIPALEMLVREAGRPETLAVDLNTSGPVRRLPPDMELAAYRIVQEALNNILQHAQASQAWVEVRFEAAELVLVVRDNGQGFDAPNMLDALARQGHFGLMGIQERAWLFGGRLTVHSAPGKGSEVSVRLPYPCGA
jgi:signal transduction histidine kinase